MKENLELVNQLKIENQQLKNQMGILADLKNLEDSSYYRRQQLVNQERMCLALEKIALELENSSEEEEETEDEESEEDSRRKLKNLKKWLIF